MTGSRMGSYGNEVYTVDCDNEFYIEFMKVFIVLWGSVGAALLLLWLFM